MKTLVLSLVALVTITSTVNASYQGWTVFNSKKDAIGKKVDYVKCK